MSLWFRLNFHRPSLISSSLHLCMSMQYVSSAATVHTHRFSTILEATRMVFALSYGTGTPRISLGVFCSNFIMHRVKCRRLHEIFSFSYNCFYSLFPYIISPYSKISRCIMHLQQITYYFSRHPSSSCQ
jgi:hypothetical protein